jgi:hypothetical protein
MNWLEIKSEEDLPPNKAKVICYEKKRGRFIAQYFRYLEQEIDDSYDDFSKDAVDLDYLNERTCIKPGWYELEEQDNGLHDEVYMKRIVTHWQPLPIKP